MTHTTSFIFHSCPSLNFTQIKPLSPTIPPKEVSKTVMTLKTRSSIGRFTLQSAALLVVLLPPCFGSPAAAATASATPIRHWEPSWVASSAQGTSLAVSCHLNEEFLGLKSSSGENNNNNNNNCVLLLMRSAAPQTVSSALEWRPPASRKGWKDLSLAHNSKNDIADTDATAKPLRILEASLDAFVATSSSQQAASSSWTPFGNYAIGSMTGLSSDVDHVSRVVQQGVHTHRIIYDATSFPCPVSQLVTSMAGTVRDAAKWKGGRPYGLQAMLVGSNNNSRQSMNKMRVYTVDPSGAWRSWGSGCTAIGRNAEGVRQNLYDELRKLLPSEISTKAFLHPKLALEIAFKSLLTATRAANVNQDSDQYEAVLFWVDQATGQCRVATIHPEDVKNCREALWNELQETKK